MTLIVKNKMKKKKNYMRRRHGNITEDNGSGKVGKDNTSNNGAKELTMEGTNRFDYDGHTTGEGTQPSTVFHAWHATTIALMHVDPCNKHFSRGNGRAR